MRNYTRQFPPQPRIIENGWGPNYPVGMTNLELLEYAPNGLFAGSVMYDLYRTNGGMGSGMVDSFQYDPITQYGNLSSQVAQGGGDTSMWFLLKNHQPPYNRYPFNSVENNLRASSESKYFENIDQQKYPTPMGIAEQTGTGWFTSLNQESNLIPTTSVGSAPKSGRDATTTSPTSTNAPSTTRPVNCPAGTVLVNGRCVRRLTPISTPPVQAPTTTPTISIRCNAGYTPVNGVCQPISPGQGPVAYVPVIPVTSPIPGGGMMGGGGGGSAAGEEAAPGEATREGALDCKTNYLIVLIAAAIGAGLGYVIAKKMGKNIKKSSLIGALIGGLLGLAYAIHQCRPIGVMSRLGINSKVAPVASKSGQSSYCGGCGA